MQVVRPFSGHELRVNDLGVMSLFDVRAQEWIGIGVVIELTEEPSNPNQTNVRWVSKWVVVDGD